MEREVRWVLTYEPDAATAAAILYLEENWCHNNEDVMWLVPQEGKNG